MAFCKYCKGYIKWIKVDSKWKCFKNNKPHLCKQYKTMRLCKKCNKVLKYKHGEAVFHECKPVKKKRQPRRTKEQIKLDNLYRGDIHLENEDIINKILQNKPLK